MKITISYIGAEEQEAAAVVAALRSLLPGAKVRKKNAHAPFIHVYFTTKKIKKSNNKTQDSHYI